MNRWITHVKKYAKKHNIGYNEALRSKKCQMEYRKTSPRGRKTSPRGRKKMNGVLDKLLGRRKGKNERETNKKMREAIMRDLNKVTDKVDRMKTEEEENLNTAIKNKRKTLETLKRGGEKKVPEEDMMELHDLSTEHLKNKCKETVNKLISMIKEETQNIEMENKSRDYIERTFRKLRDTTSLFRINCDKFYSMTDTDDKTTKEIITENKELLKVYGKYRGIYDRYKRN